MDNLSYQETEKIFVRIKDGRQLDQVTFEFAIGRPEIFAEMSLSPTAFGPFCKVNNTVVLTDTRLA